MFQKHPDKIAYCYGRAGQSRANAANCAQVGDIQGHLQIERCWSTLARSYQLSEHIGRFSDEVGRRRVRVLIRPNPPDPAIPIVKCSECGKRMRLALIVPCLPATRRADTWTFACECGFSCEQIMDRAHAPTRS
jgi:hypothetical protein